MASFERYLPLLEKLQSDSNQSMDSTASSNSNANTGLTKDDQFQMNMLRNEVVLIKQTLKQSKIDTIDKLAGSIKELKNDLKIMK